MTTDQAPRVGPPEVGTVLGAGTPGIPQVPTGLGMLDQTLRERFGVTLEQARREFPGIAESVELMRCYEDKEFDTKIRDRFPEMTLAEARKIAPDLDNERLWRKLEEAEKIQEAQLANATEAPEAADDPTPASGVQGR